MRKYKLSAAIAILILAVQMTGCTQTSKNISSEESSGQETSSHEEVSSSSEDASDTMPSAVKQDITYENLLIGKDRIYLYHEDFMEILYTCPKEGSQVTMQGVDVNRGNMVVLIDEELSDLDEIEYYFEYIDEDRNTRHIKVPEEYCRGLSLDSLYNGRIYFTYYDDDYEDKYIGVCDPSTQKFRKDDRYTLTWHKLIKDAGNSSIMYRRSIVYDLAHSNCIYLRKDGCVMKMDKDMQIVSSVDTGYKLSDFLVFDDGRGVAGYYESYNAANTEDTTNCLIYCDVNQGISYPVLDLDEHPYYSVCALKDNYLYYSAIEGDYNPGGDSVIDFYRLDVSSSNNEPELIYAAHNTPMLPKPYAYLGGTNGFTVIGDEYWVLCDNGTKMVWSKAKMDSQVPQMTGCADCDIEGRMFGDAYLYTNETAEDDDGYVYFHGYMELFKFANIPNADKLNEELDLVNRELVQRLESEKEHAKEDMDNDDAQFMKENGMYYSYDLTFNNVRRINDDYIQITYSDYVYWGGAHGMGGNIYCLFDLNSGKNVKLKDITPLTEEEFKDVVAEKSVEFWRENSEIFFTEYTPDSEKAMFDDFRNAVSLEDQVDFYSDVVIYEYPPYLFAPYASGYIPIRLSYEDLKIKNPA